MWDRRLKVRCSDRSPTADLLRSGHDPMANPIARPQPAPFLGKRFRQRPGRLLRGCAIEAPPAATQGLRWIASVSIRQDGRLLTRCSALGRPHNRCTRRAATASHQVPLGIESPPRSRSRGRPSRTTIGGHRCSRATASRMGIQSKAGTEVLEADTA